MTVKRIQIPAADANPPPAGRPRVGLALGGGVARGLAHIGVLEVLLRERIPIDVVAGSSAGSLIGAFFCAGFDLAAIEEMAARIRWRNIASLTLSRRGFISFGKLEILLEATIGPITFAQLRTPFTAAATDLETGEAIWLREGRVARAVRASCSVPGVVTPVEWGGRLLGDGNFSDSVPAAAARALGAEFVIGVDIFRPQLRRWLGPAGYALAGIESAIRATGGGADQADCRIAPQLAGKSYVRFDKLEEYRLLGREAAARQIPTLRQKLHVPPPLSS